MSAHIYDRRIRHQARCRRCGAPAVWYYSPGIRSWHSCIVHDRRNAFCDDCVHRGCSCQQDSHTGLIYRDRRWRKMPCCEFEYVPHGLYFTQSMNLLFLPYGATKYPYRISKRRMELDWIIRRKILTRKTFTATYAREETILDPPYQRP
jgi:hypothetical protein